MFSFSNLLFEENRLMLKSTLTFLLQEFLKEKQTICLKMSVNYNEKNEYVVKIRVIINNYSI